MGGTVTSTGGGWWMVDGGWWVVDSGGWWLVWPIAPSHSVILISSIK